ncbi:MAG: hypothetical protein AB8A46_05620 [Prochlorococcus sp.]
MAELARRKDGEAAEHPASKGYFSGKFSCQFRYKGCNSSIKPLKELTLKSFREPMNQATKTFLGND